MRVLIQSKAEGTFSPALLWRPRTGAGEREREGGKKAEEEKVNRRETGGRKKAKVLRTERTTEAGMRRKVSGSLDTSLGGRGHKCLAERSAARIGGMGEKGMGEELFDLRVQYRFLDNNVS